MLIITIQALAVEIPFRDRLIRLVLCEGEFLQRALPPVMLPVPVIMASWSFQEMFGNARSRLAILKDVILQDLMAMVFLLVSRAMRAMPMPQLGRMRILKALHAG